MLGKDDYAHLFCHVIYRDQPYSTHDYFKVSFEPGQNDWTEFSVVGAATQSYPIEKLHITIGGKFTRGRYYIDDVQLTEDKSLAEESSAERVTVVSALPSGCTG